VIKSKNSITANVEVLEDVIKGKTSLSAAVMDLKVPVFEQTGKNKTVSYGVFQVEPGMTLEKLTSAIAEKNKKIASYKWVTHFAMTTNDLPLTSTQKIKHHVVRERLEKGEYPIKKD
jgi:hypothetical protein